MEHVDTKRLPEKLAAPKEEDLANEYSIQNGQDLFAPRRKEEKQEERKSKRKSKKESKKHKKRKHEKKSRRYASSED